MNGLKILMLLVGLLPSLTYAQVKEGAVYVVDTNRQVHDLAANTTLFIDSLGTKTVDQLADSQFDRLFQRFAGPQKTFSKKINYWLRIPIKASAPVQGWWLLIKTSPNIYGYYAQWEYMDVYSVDSIGKISLVGVGGVLRPRSQKTAKVGAGLSAVQLSLPAAKTQTLLIRLRNDFSNGLSPLPELRNPVVGIPANPYVQLGYGLSAIAAIMSLLSFFFLIFIREKSYLFFGIYLFLLSFHYLIIDPSLSFINTFIPEHPQLVFYFFHLFTTSDVFFFLLFGRYFINLPQLSTRVDLFLKWLIWIWGVVSVAELVLMMVYREGVLFPIGFSVLLILILGLLIRIAFFNSILARFYVAGALWLLVFSVMGYWWENGYINPGFNPWPVAQVGQMIIYLIGLAYKIRLNERARAEAERIKEIDAIKSRFFANISHEFRTPLTLIQGPLKKLEVTTKSGATFPTDVVTRQLKTMRRNTDRLLELVNQLLDLSKLDSGAMQLRMVRGDVIQLIKVIAGSFDSMAERKRIHYYVTYPETTMLGYLDRDKLEKIVTNLLSNAFKYTPEGGTVAVRAEIDEKRFRLSIEDSGPGIAQKELEQIFDRFYRVEAVESVGSGIGLALVKELMDLYRGQISVSSEPGRGSRFKISLAIDAASFRPDEIMADVALNANRDVASIDLYDEEESTGVAPTIPSTPNLPVALIVEDNTDLRQFIAESIAGHYVVLEEKSGTEGWESALSSIPDIIISDVMMPVLAGPEMNGFQLTEKLKKDERTSHIPVILLTAKAGHQHKLEGLKTGADDYLTKPFDASELLIRMENLIAQRRLLRKKFAGQIVLKPSDITAESTDDRFLQKVMCTIEKHLANEDFNVEKLADSVAMSRSQLHRKLQALVDKSPSDLLRQTRLFRAKELLQKKAGVPSEVAHQVGFSSHTYFSRAFRDEFGMSPSEV
ncbi:response regulator [Spirosoma sp. BT702]|uniref:histidine kinase n=1 Tax=Spirosoma profusum TaxID=2771354 RepID=A0A926XWF7_9BACT|nr:ATP-binding protein [Spirosoma profusum]MBD2701176.1 response regulator [Spirosoma profusum]